jgi:hypothetical protein
MKTPLGIRLLPLFGLLVPIATAVLPGRPAAQCDREGEDLRLDRRSRWRLAGGAPIRLATEMARIVDDGPNLHVLPIVTRVENVNVN